MFTIKGGKVVCNQQGDIPIVPVATKFEGKNVAENGRAILAYGEVTGHAHVIDNPRAKLVRDADVIAALTKELIEKGILDQDAKTVDAGLIIADGDPVALMHEEHETHMLAPGRYAVLRQREYSPEEIRRVED